MSTPSLLSYLSFEDVVSICKLAEVSDATKKKLHTAGTLLAAPVGMAAGTLAGFGAAHLGNKAYAKLTGKDVPIPYLMAAAPIVLGGLGMAYNLAQAHQMEQLRRAAEGSHNKP